MAREGWAEAFKESANLSDDDLAWLDFPNDTDAKLVWDGNL